MPDFQEDVNLMQNLIDTHDRIVFFGGAGVSTESGIPDFRSKDGLYNQKYKYDPETIISFHFFETYTKDFYEFYKDRMLLLDKKPNGAHLFLSKLEKSGKLKAIVTQNIDGLHQMAGSKNVIELHGSIHRNYCMDCGAFYDGNFMKNSKDIIPHCPKCGGVIKPDVVLYGEALDNGVIDKAIYEIRNADLLIVAGTSLVVYPAASFINVFCGDKLVLINKDPTAADNRADYTIHQKAGELFERLHV